jgi:hypothetical protein
MPINRGFKPMRKPQDSDVKTRVCDFLQLLRRFFVFVFIGTKESNIIIDK